MSPLSEPKTKWTVRIDREDGSRTYRCRTTSRPQADREAAAWADAFPCATVTVMDVEATRVDMRDWDRAVKKNPTARYRPEKASA